MATDQAVASLAIRRESVRPARPADDRSSFAAYETDGFYDEMFDEAGRSC